jgi:hypothetical protein
MSVSRTVEIAAPPEVVWDLVSDLPGMGRFSPENVGGRWRRGATGPAVGARFAGANRRGLRRWSTAVVVTTCEPGRAFGFDVSSVLLPVSHWSYDIEPTPGGCRLTETWRDRRGRLVALGGRLLTGVRDRESHTGLGIEQTLASVKSAAEERQAS